MKLPKGSEVRYIHQRYALGDYGRLDSRWNLRQAGLLVDPRGGKTIAIIRNAEGEELARGEVECSAQDNYNRRIGRKIALDRAVYALHPRRKREPTTTDALMYRLLGGRAISAGSELPSRTEIDEAAAEAIANILSHVRDADIAPEGVLARAIDTFYRRPTGLEG